MSKNTILATSIVTAIEALGLKHAKLEHTVSKTIDEVMPPKVSRSKAQAILGEEGKPTHIKCVRLGLWLPVIGKDGETNFYETKSSLGYSTYSKISKALKDKETKEVSRIKSKALNDMMDGVVIDPKEVNKELEEVKEKFKLMRSLENEDIVALGATVEEPKAKPIQTKEGKWNNT